MPAAGRLGRLLDEQRTRLRAHLAEPLFTSAYSLIASTLLTASLGIVFWAAAARLYPAAEVGRDAVLISVLSTLSSVCQLNLVDALVRFLPGVSARKRARTIASAYGSSALAALVVGTAFVVLAPLASRRLDYLSNTPLALMFVGSLIVYGVFVIEDAVLTSLRRAYWVPIENSAFALAKIGLLAPLLVLGVGHGVFLSWFAPTFVFVVVVNRLLWTRVIRPAARATQVAIASSVAPPRRALALFLTQDYAGYVLAQAPGAVLPLIVLADLGSRYNAYFAIPYALMGAFDVLFYNVTMSLTVEAVHDAARTVELARKVLRFLRLQVPIAGLIALAAPLLLLPFGPAYVHHGTPVLRLLACASVFRTPTYMFVALSRLSVRGLSIMRAQGALSSASIVLALLLVGPLGLSGVSLAWLIANAGMALALVPSLSRLLRSPTKLEGAP
jgi:O-antigen/teichoic acid export membrane protein